jgi:structural maintenance of chromosome 2
LLLDRPISDFGSIFAELLPGNFAKLQPPEGMDITEGLEVKIRLGSVWKASLTELSGGQRLVSSPTLHMFLPSSSFEADDLSLPASGRPLRSLIALSLIMSLLQFKPAPMYILDEIDAALDLSHTQHIGSLFRNRFKGSQFIVVSLKEGLFTNANVLFKAKVSIEISLSLFLSTSFCKWESPLTCLSDWRTTIVCRWNFNS